MRETPLPPTSVIVCSRNRPELLVRAVRSVYEGAQGFNEIVVVDQSDTPNAHLQACGLVYLWRPSRGAGRARNAGIQAASHKVLAFIDDDVIVTPGWLEVLVSALVGTGPRSVVTGMVREGRTESGEGFAPPTLVETKPAVYEGRITKDVLYTGNMAVYRSAFEEIGLFDERLGPGTAFPAAEDNDLGLRLLRAGYRIHYVPEAVVDHLAWRTASDYLPFKWRYGRGQGAYYAKHMMLGDTRIWGRMGKDLAEQTFPLLWRIWRSRRQACGQAVFAAGLVTGCLEWMWTEGFDRKGKSGWNLRL